MLLPRPSDSRQSFVFGRHVTTRFVKLPCSSMGKLLTYSYHHELSEETGWFVPFISLDCSTLQWDAGRSLLWLVASPGFCASKGTAFMSTKSGWNHRNFYIRVNIIIIINISELKRLWICGWEICEVFTGSLPLPTGVVRINRNCQIGVYEQAPGAPASAPWLVTPIAVTGTASVNSHVDCLLIARVAGRTIRKTDSLVQVCCA